MRNSPTKTTKLIDHHGKFGNTKQYHDNNYGWSNRTWVAGSCGCRFIDNPKSNIDVRRPHVGIKLVTGHVGKATRTEAYAIAHLTTKNGPLTCSIRKKRKNV